jgi:hypothetical protein
MDVSGISLAQLVTTTGLGAKLISAIVAGHYTPSPVERERLAAAVGVSKTKSRGNTLSGFNIFAAMVRNADGLYSQHLAFEASMTVPRSTREVPF